MATKLKVFSTGVYNNYTEDTFDRYNIIAKNQKLAVLLTKKEYGLSDFKQDKHLKVDVNTGETMTLEEYNKENETNYKKMGVILD